MLAKVHQTGTWHRVGDYHFGMVPVYIVSIVAYSIPETEAKGGREGREIKEGSIRCTSDIIIIIVNGMVKVKRERERWWSMVVIVNHSSDGILTLARKS